MSILYVVISILICLLIEIKNKLVIIMFEIKIIIDYINSLKKKNFNRSYLIGKN